MDCHPVLFPIAKEVFDTYLPERQLDFESADGSCHYAPGSSHPVDGDITEAGLRWNVEAGLQYLDSWLRGSACAPFRHREGSEICRAQVC
jgi:malate synthase